MEKKKKSIFKRWWFWVIVVIVVAGIGGANGGSKDKKEEDKTSNNNVTVTEETSSGEFVEKVKIAIQGAISSEDEFITDVVLKDEDLRITVDLSKADPEPFTIEELAISRTGSITDAILELSDYDSQWKTITIDFGDIGKIANSKDSIKENEVGGRYFPSENFTLQSDQKVSEEPKTEPFETNLKAGYYTVGVDIPAGTYTFTAVAGSGNVISSNTYRGGLNEIMAAQADEYSISEFKNAKMEKGVTLNLSGTIELKISCDSASVSEMEQRKNLLTEEVQLGSGNYVAGTDFPAGEYDVVAVDGSGNVNSSNMYSGGLNEIFSTATDGYSISEYKNAQMEEGVELSISSCTIKLVPSK